MSTVCASIVDSNCMGPDECIDEQRLDCVERREINVSAAQSAPSQPLVQEIVTAILDKVQ